MALGDISEAEEHNDDTIPKGLNQQGNETTVNPANDNTLPAGWSWSDQTSSVKFIFNTRQTVLETYFRNKKAIDFDIEMKMLEKERLLEKKKKKELEWRERKKEKLRRTAKMMAEYILIEVTNAGAEAIKKKAEEERKKRKQKADTESTTFKLKRMKISSPKKRKSLFEAEHDRADTPSKKLRGGSEGELKNQNGGARGQWEGGTISKIFEVLSLPGVHLLKPPSRCTAPPTTTQPTPPPTQTLGIPPALLCYPPPQVLTAAKTGSVKDNILKLGLTASSSQKPKHLNGNCRASTAVQKRKELGASVGKKVTELEKKTTTKPKRKVRKWQKKKDGLYGWVMVSSIPEKENRPQ